MVRAAPVKADPGAAKHPLLSGHSRAAQGCFLWERNAWARSRFATFSPLASFSWGDGRGDGEENRSVSRGRTNLSTRWAGLVAGDVSKRWTEELQIPQGHPGNRRESWNKPREQSARSADSACRQHRSSVHTCGRTVLGGQGFDRDHRNLSF